MPAPLVVPDASVILKWVLPSPDEPDTARGLALRDAIVQETVRAFVPALWLFEVGNTVVRRFPAHASAWLTALLRFELEQPPVSSPWVATAIDLARRYGVTFYDASYHAVAIVHDGAFVTADMRYVRRTRAAGAVVALGAWTPPR